MLKFFRQIRQRLLRENRFSKYLFYAVGEIILIVIGIMIALQLNNWNEERKVNQREKKLLKELVANLRTNEQVLLDNISVETERIEAIDKLLGLTHLFEPTDSLDAYFSQVMYREQFSISRSSFDNLKSIGLDIIKNDSLKLRITHLFEVTYALEKENIDLVSVTTMNQVANFIFTHPRFFNDFKAGDFSDRESTEKYQLLLGAKKTWKVDIIKGSHKVLKETRDVISSIENYLSEP